MVVSSLADLPPLATLPKGPTSRQLIKHSQNGSNPRHPKMEWVAATSDTYGPIFQLLIKLTVIYYSLNFNIIENVKSSFNTTLNGSFL